MSTLVIGTKTIDKPPLDTKEYHEATERLSLLMKKAPESPKVTPLTRKAPYEPPKVTPEIKEAWYQLRFMPISITKSHDIKNFINNINTISACPSLHDEKKKMQKIAKHLLSTNKKSYSESKVKKIFTLVNENRKYLEMLSQDQRKTINRNITRLSSFAQNVTPPQPLNENQSLLDQAVEELTRTADNDDLPIPTPTRESTIASTPPQTPCSKY